MNTNENPGVVAVNWEGFWARQAGDTFASNPHATDAFKRALWSKGWSDADEGRFKPESAFDAYYIVDDALEGQSKEGYHVYYGCPHRAIGVKQGEFLQLGAARRSIGKDEPAYRVKLARRHGEHSVKLLPSPACAGDSKAPSGADEAKAATNSATITISNRL